MRFGHTPQIWATFPQLVPVAAVVRGINAAADTGPEVEEFSQRAAARLVGRTEAELVEIQAWRRAFSQMGLKPTQYRCASEALLRRFRREGQLPRLHPLVDLCNAVSLAYAVPIAVFDLTYVDGWLEVATADSTESYETFSGDTEYPDLGEVIFRDAANRAHARRWTNRQSGLSAVKATTTDALIVSEALHDTASSDQTQLLSALTNAIERGAGHVTQTQALTAGHPTMTW